MAYRDYCIVAFPHYTIMDEAVDFLKRLLMRRTVGSSILEPWLRGSSESFDRLFDLERRLHARDMDTSMFVYVFQSHEIGNYVRLLLKSPIVSKNGPPEGFVHNKTGELRTTSIACIDLQFPHTDGPTLSAPSLFIDFDPCTTTSPILLPSMTALSPLALLCIHKDIHQKNPEEEEEEECDACIQLQYESYMTYAFAWLEYTARMVWRVCKIGVLREQVKGQVMCPQQLPLPPVLSLIIWHYLLYTGNDVFETLC